MANKRSGDVEKTPNLNEGHAVNNKQYELVHGTMGKNNNSGGPINPVVNKRPKGPNKFGEAKKNSGRVGDSEIFKRPSKPSGSGVAKIHPDRVIEFFVL